MAGEGAIGFAIFQMPADAKVDLCQFVAGGGRDHRGHVQDALEPEAGAEGFSSVVEPSVSSTADRVPLVRDVTFVFVPSGYVLIDFDAGGGGQLLIRWRGVELVCIDGHRRHD
jgi:hypothetical protein